MAITKIHPIKSTLRSALTYVLEGKKTNESLLISSFACSPETADIEFRFTLSQCMQKGNNLAFHVIQSFKPGETDQDTAHQIGQDLALKTLKGKYEYVLSTHVDKGHIHNHLIFCAANFIDFHKYISNKKSYYQIRKNSDRLCEQYGLSVVIPGEDRGKCYKEYIAAKTGTSWKDRMRKAAFQSMKHSSTFEEFALRMNLSGYEVRLGDKLAFRPVGQKRFILSTTLSYSFSERHIRNEISQRMWQSDIHKSSVGTERMFDLTISSRAEKGHGYTRVLRTKKLKIAARMLSFLLDNGIHSYRELKSKLEQITIAFNEARSNIKLLETRINELTVIVKKLSTIQGFSETKSPSQNQILIKDAAIKFLLSKDIHPPYPDIADIASQIVGLHAEKESLYGIYYSLRKNRREFSTVQKNVDMLLQRRITTGLEKE